MASEVRPIRTKRDYEAAPKEVEQLWGGKAERARATGWMCLRPSSMPMRRSTIRWTHLIRSKPSEAGQRLAAQTIHPPPLAQCQLRRHSPEVGAVCGKIARTVLCGGRSAMSYRDSDS